VPQPDPTPGPRQSAVRRFWRIVRLLALLALVVAALAVILVSRGDPTLHIHMIVATGVGIFLTMLVGTGLMTLVFISSSSGHDEAAAHHQQENDQE
jgi:hypothetical protein